MTADPQLQLEFPLDGHVDKRGKPRNRRVVTLATLRQIKRYASWATDDWTVSGEVFMPPEERAERETKPGTFRSWMRPRRQEEYPENSPEKWLMLARWMQAIELHAQDVRLWAKEQERLTRERLASNKGDA